MIEKVSFLLAGSHHGWKSKKVKAQKGKKIIFIHGKGEGVLRHTIIHELNYRYKKCTYQDASFREYGYGATQVTIK